jgi:hypothetical protein
MQLSAASRWLHDILRVIATLFMCGEDWKSSRESQTNKQANKQIPWPLIRERTLPTERPILVGEI